MNMIGVGSYYDIVIRDTQRYIDCPHCDELICISEMVANIEEVSGECESERINSISNLNYEFERRKISPPQLPSCIKCGAHLRMQILITK